MTKGVRQGIVVLMLLVAVILIVPTVMAVQNRGHITLLAVYHEGENFSGSPADLELEIKPGSGRVFIETIPLSKVDTQISTRFAKSMACKFADVDCGAYDFFYTIKSTAGIVGGPSAGSAVAVLTAAMLMDLDVDQEATVTGTINSGELIGPVGSLKEKVDAGKMAGVSKVLIPAVQQEVGEENITNLVDYGKEKGVEVVPVNTLAEAMTELTEEDFIDEDKEIVVPELYIETMKDVSEELCQRAEKLINESSIFDLNNQQEVIIDNINAIQSAKNLTKFASKALEEEKYYSAASYCFGANQRARKVLIEEQGMTDEEFQEEVSRLKEEAKVLDKTIDEFEKETITDLQTYMIVKDRILQVKKLLEKNNSETLAYATERLNSARIWSGFFGKEGEKYDLDEAILKKSCETSLQEIEERFQYLNLFFPGLLSELRADLNRAHEYYADKEYGLCIFISSRTKADANIFVTLLGVKEEAIDHLVEQKLKAAKRAITEQIDKGTFPILANSYYEYATSLSKESGISGLLYAEYALEMSNINIYLESGTENNNGKLKISLWKIIPILLFLWGLFLGYLYAWIKGKEKKQKSGKGKGKKGKKAKGKKAKSVKKMERTTRTNIRLRG